MKQATARLSSFIRYAVLVSLELPVDSSFYRPGQTLSFALLISKRRASHYSSHSTLNMIQMDSLPSIPRSATLKQEFIVEDVLLTVVLTRQHSTKLLVKFQYEPLQSCHACGLCLAEDTGDKLMVSSIRKHPQLKSLIGEKKEVQFCQCDSTSTGKANAVECETKLSRSGLRKRRGQASSLDGFIQRRREMLEEETTLREANELRAHPLDQSLLLLASQAPEALANQGVLRLIERLWFPPVPASVPASSRLLGRSMGFFVQKFPRRGVTNRWGRSLWADFIQFTIISDLTEPVESKVPRNQLEQDFIDSMVNTSEQAPLIVEASRQQSGEYRRALMAICSLVISLWWSADHDDVSGGFGIGSYMLTLSSAIVAVTSYAHRSTCRCWKREQVLPMWEAHNGLGGSNVVHGLHDNHRITP
ncbi:hypothetical protein M434DRAFT_36027 [Hypoxylon sp. CO27-5]|nr:hypothetical protein M434DRAFT_36027 [Hypoxylon sp. CO27-5]